MYLVCLSVGGIKHRPFKMLLPTIPVVEDYVLLKSGEMFKVTERCVLQDNQHMEVVANEKYRLSAILFVCSVSDVAIGKAYWSAAVEASLMG